ncbi:MAG: replication factor C large subunit [Candidatus Heimdallarchaeota archaeon]|nr:replication factor C large subunit [Candidatus Heimdallarchaeota archaeon]MCK4878773.1 replication factor C large subunit [Candidatus Heimdallarchaeota archaeon]
MAMQSKTQTIPWVEKYRPETFKDFVGNREEVRKLENWLKTWNQQRKKAVLLAGPAGVGKTSVVYYLIKKYNYEFVEVNASDKRNKKAVEMLVGKSSTEGTVLQGARVRKLILVDEADGLFGNADRGGGQALGRAVKATRTPIICTANDPSASALKAAKRNMLVIEFKSLKDEEILTLLKLIKEKENLSVSEDILLAITENSGGDARSAINDLEGVSVVGIKEVTFSPRNQEKSLDTALINIFQANDYQSAKRAIDGLDVDYRELLMYVFEHAYKQASTNTELFNMYELIAEADMYLSHCYKKQDWKFLKYFFTFISSVGLVKSSPFKYTKFGFPGYWALMGRLRGKNAKINAIAKKSIRYLHCSQRIFVKEIYPYLRIIFNSDPKMAGGIAAFLQFDEENISFLTNDSNKLIKEIMKHKEVEYVQMAEQWMTKAKETEMTVFDFIKKSKTKKPKAQVKDKKTVAKEKKQEETTTSEKKETKVKKDKIPESKNKNKKSSQASLEKYMEK